MDKFSNKIVGDIGEDIVENYLSGQGYTCTRMAKAGLPNYEHLDIQVSSGLSEECFIQVKTTMYQINHFFPMHESEMAKLWKTYRQFDDDALENCYVYLVGLQACAKTGLRVWRFKFTDLICEGLTLYKPKRPWKAEIQVFEAGIDLVNSVGKGIVKEITLDLAPDQKWMAKHFVAGTQKNLSLDL